MQALNKQEIYFLGDLVKYSEQSLKDLEGIGAKTVDTVKEELAKYNLHLEMEPKSYYELKFSLDSFDISLLNLEESLECKIRSININTLDNLFFSNKVELFTVEELLQIRNGFKKLGFDVNKSFCGATVSGDVLEYNNLILQKKLYEEKLKEIPTKELVEESISTGEALNKEKKVSIVVPKSELNPHDLLVPVTVNGYTYQIIRGEEVEVPVTIKNILKEAKYI